MRKASLLLTTLLLLGLLAGPAAAHNLTVDPPGQSDGTAGWVGGEPLPQEVDPDHPGLVVGGPPDDQVMQSPAHEGGLNTACEALEANDNDVVDIRGPGGPGCGHGQ